MHGLYAPVQACWGAVQHLRHASSCCTACMRQIEPLPSLLWQNPEEPTAAQKIVAFKEAFWKFLRPHTIRGTILGSTAVTTIALLENTGVSRVSGRQVCTHEAAGLQAGRCLLRHRLASWPHVVVGWRAGKAKHSGLTAWLPFLHLACFAAD